MDLCGCKYSFYHTRHFTGVTQVYCHFVYKEIVSRHFSIIVQPSNSTSNEGEKVMDSDTILSEKLQNIMDKYNEAKECSNTE